MSWSLALWSLPAVIWVQGQTKNVLPAPAPFDPKNIRESLQRIHRTGRFRAVDVLYHPDKKDYEIVLWERVRVQSVRFSEIPEGASEALNRLAQEMLGREYTQAKLQGFRKETMKVLHDYGYLSAVLNVLVKEDTSDLTRVDFSVELSAGPRCQLQKIQTNIQDPKLEEITLDLMKLRADLPLDASDIKGKILEFAPRAVEGNYLRPRIQNYKIEMNTEKTEAILKINFDTLKILDFQFTGDLGGLSKSSLEQFIRKGLQRYQNTDEIAAAVRTYYLSRGYSQAQVSVRTFPSSEAGTDRLEFQVNSGLRTRLVAVRWRGLESLSEDDLNSFLSRFGPETTAKGVFSEGDLQAGISQLEIFFKNRGLFRAKILNVQVHRGKDTESREIEITLIEGAVTRLRHFELEGIPSELAETLKTEAQLTTGDLLNLDLLESFLDELPERLKNRGYFYAQSGEDLVSVESMVQFSTGFEQADVKIPIRLGPRARFGPTRVYGLNRTRPVVVLREIQWEQGDFYDQEKVEEMRFRLNRTGLFRSLRFEFSRTLEEEEKALAAVEVPVDIYVDERPAGLFETGIGLRTDEGFKGFAGIAYRNLGGMNRAVSSRVEMNARFPNNYNFLEPVLNVGYLEPWLGPVPLASRTNFLFEKRDTFDRGRTSTEIGTELQYQFTRHITLRHLVYQIASSQSFNFRLTDGSIDRVRRDSERIAVIGPVFIMDYRNDLFNPSSGWMFQTQLRYSAPWFGSDADIRFLHTLTSIRAYVPLFPGLVLALFTGYGVAWGLNDGKIAQDYILKLGGRTSLRSYQQNSVGPSGSDLRYVRVNQSVNTRAELRYKIWNEFGIATFWDGGNVFVNGHSVGGYRHSVGMGLRYETPVGPASLDFAYGVDDEPLPSGQEDRWRIFFSLGTF